MILSEREATKGEKMGRREELENAQALIEKFAGQSNVVEEKPQEETSATEERANPQQVETPIVEEVPETVVEVQQPVVSNDAVNEELKALKEEIEKVKHSYKTLQGKYNAELPTALKENARLQAELNILKDQIQQQQASANAEIPKSGVDGLKELLGQDKVDELGENYVELVEEATQYKIQQALSKQESEASKKLEEIQAQLEKDKWNNYNKEVVSRVPNFIDLVDPYGDGRLNEKFGEFLTSNYMFDAFDNADKTMNVSAVVDICNRYIDSIKPQEPVAQNVQPQVEVPQHNPKAQAVAPSTVNNSSPQMQSSAPIYAYNLSDYITRANAFAQGKMTHSQWFAFETNYNNALRENKVNLNA